MQAVGRGLIQTVPVFYNPPEQLQNIAEMGEISRATGLLCTVAPIVHNAMSTLWKDSLDALEAEAARGAQVFGQSMPRTFDINIRLSETSFLLYALPAWAEIMRLPLPGRLAAFRDPARRDELRNQAVLLGPHAWTSSRSARRPQPRTPLSGALARRARRRAWRRRRRT